MRVTDKPVTEYAAEIFVCQSPHVQLNDDQSQLTTSSTTTTTATSAADHSLFSLVHSSPANVKRKCPLPPNSI